MLIQAWKQPGLLKREIEPSHLWRKMHIDVQMSPI